jgi:hypothetical protein
MKFLHKILLVKISTVGCFCFFYFITTVGCFNSIGAVRNTYPSRAVIFGCLESA